MGAKGSKARKSQEEKMGNQPQVCDPYFRKLLITNRGLLNIKLKVPIYDSYSLSLVYTPGVGESCMKIKDNIEDAHIYTNISNSLAIVTDGSDYKNSSDPKWCTDACIPQLEAQALFYKVHSNIDAFPFIIDPKLTKTDEEYIECLRALQGSVSGVELYNIDEQRIASLIPKIEQQKLTLAVMTSTERSYISERIQKIDQSALFPDGFITASIFRAALDCKFRGVINKDFIDHVFGQIESLLKQSQIDFSKQWGTSLLLHKEVVTYIFSKNQSNSSLNQNQIIQRFDHYMLQGKNAWVINDPNKEYVDPNNLKQNSLELHKRFQGMMKTSSKIKPKSIQKFYDMAKDYCYEGLEDEIMANPPLVQELTFKANWCAIITNGTAVLGFGDIGATAGLPVMEGKSCIFKQLGGVDVVPMCIQEKDPKKLIDIIMRLSPIFSAINLEDIKAPECFEIENTLKEKLDIPVFHDDQHGTAIVVVSAVINSLKLMKKQPSEVKLIVNGGGAAGLSITQLLLDIGITNIITCDTKGAIYKGRPNNMNAQKEQIANLTNPNNEQGDLEKVIEGADIFIGVSAAGALKPEWAAKMTEKNLILAMANPVPEIMPEEAKKVGAFIVGTGRSDFKNQTNNSLAFPGIFRGALDVRAKNITQEMKLAASYAIANLIPDYELSPDYVIPSSLDTRVPIAVSKAVGMKAIEQGIARRVLTEQQLEQNMRNYIVERNLLNIKSQ